MIRVIQIAVLIVLCFLLISCTPKSDNNFPDNIKIKDLAPINVDGSPKTNKLKTINFDLQILEIPVENFSKLGEIRRILNVRPIKFNNYLAFSANSFSAYNGKFQTLRNVFDLLQIAGAKNITSMGIFLLDGGTDDVVIKKLAQIQTVSFNSLKGDEESVRVGPPGVIAMHIKAEKVTSLDDSAAVTICPFFISNTISQFNLINKQRDFPFTSTALQMNMVPGDFMLLVPERYISDQSTLSGVFFSNPDGNMFYTYDESKPPEHKPSFRVYLLTCIGMNI